jgi:hypothetical protein
MSLSSKELEGLKALRSKLSEDDQKLLDRQEEEFRNATIRGAIPAIMARNFSHSLGSHLLRVE